MLRCLQYYVVKISCCNFELIVRCTYIASVAGRICGTFFSPSRSTSFSILRTALVLLRNFILAD